MSLHLLRLRWVVAVMNDGFLLKLTGFRAIQNNSEDGHSGDVRVRLLAPAKPNREVRHLSRRQKHRTRSCTLFQPFNLD